MNTVIVSKSVCLLLRRKMYAASASGPVQAVCVSGATFHVTNVGPGSLAADYKKGLGMH